MKESPEGPSAGLAAIRWIAGIGVTATILALWPDTNSPSHDPKYLIIGILPLVLGLGWLLHRIRHTPGACVNGIPFQFLAGFLIFQCVSALFSANVPASLAACAPFLALGLIGFFVAQGVREPDQAWQILRWIGIAVALSSVYGLAQKAGWDPFPWAMRDVEEYKGLPATYGNPNVASHCLGLGFVTLVGLSFRRGTRWCLILAVPIALHLVLTEVRSIRIAVLAAAGVVAVALVFRHLNMAPRKALFAICGVVALAGIVATTAAMVYTKTFTGDYLPSGHSLLLRYNGYFGACQMILDKPLLGFGPGMYRIENPPYWTPYEAATFATEARYNEHVHNAYLESGVESGLGGAFLYIGFVVSLIMQSLGLAITDTDRRRRLLALTLAACFIVFAVDGLFGFNLRSPASAIVLVVLAGVAVGISSPPSSGKHTPRRRGLLLPVMFCGAASLLAVFAVVTFTSQVLRQKATAAETLGYPDHALRFLDTALNLVPWDDAMIRQAAAVEASQGQIDNAIQRYKQALKRNPFWVMDHLELARLYFRLSETQNESFLNQAKASVEKALDLCATLPGAHEMLGRIALAEALNEPEASPGQRDRIASAVDQFQQALRYGISDREQVHRMMAQAYLILGKTDEAERAYKRAAELSSGTDVTWALFKQFAADTGRWSAFSDALNRALDRIGREAPEDCSETARITRWLADAYDEGFKDRTLASQLLEQRIRSCPRELSLWGAYVTLHDATYDRNRLLVTLTHLDGVLESHEERPAEVASLLAFLTAPDWNATQQVTAFLETWPEHLRQRATHDVAAHYGWLFSVYGSALATSAEPPAARGELLLRLGAAAANAGLWTQSNEVLTAAAPLLPPGRDVESLLLRVDALEAMQRYAEARNVAEQAVKRGPSDYRAQHALARQSALSGRAAEARLAYRLLLSRYVLNNETRGAIEQEMIALLGDGP